MKIVGNAVEKLKPHLSFLAENIIVEFDVVPPALRLNDEVVYIRDINLLDLFIERLLVRSNYIMEHGLKGDEVGLLTYYLHKLIVSAFAAEEELTWEGEGVKYFIEASDGFTVPVHGFIVYYGEELIASDITYVLAKKEVETKKGVEEKQVVEPLLVYSKFRNGIIVERGFIPPLGVSKPLVFNVSGRPLRVEAKSVGLSKIATLMTVKTVRKFVRGGNAKSFPELFNMVKNRLMKYVSFKWDQRLYDVVSCYIIGTYFYDMFAAYPRIHYTGPYGAGKTRAMLTTTYMSRHGVAFLNPSEAAEYRSIEAYGPTIGVDEKAFTKTFELLAAAGYKRSGRVPRVSKTLKEKFILELFNVYAPVVFSSVEELSEQLEPKTITITMQIVHDEDLEREDPEPWHLEDVREELYLARLTRAWEVLEVKKGFEVHELSGRPFELWCPLLVVAKLSGEEVYRNVLSYAIEDTSRRFEETYVEEKKLLEAIDRLFYGKIRELETHETLIETKITPQFTVEFQAKDIHNILKEIMVEENKEIDERNFMRKWNTRKIGRKLHKSFKLENVKTTGGKRIYSISLEKFLELCKTFGYTPSEELKEKIHGVALVARVAFSQRNPESPTPSETPSEHEETPSELPSESTRPPPRKMPLMPLMPLKEAILKVLSTREASKGLRDVEIYGVLAELQKRGVLKVTVSYDAVGEALKELKGEGKVVEEKGLWKVSR